MLLLFKGKQAIADDDNRQPACCCLRNLYHQKGATENLRCRRFRLPLLRKPPPPTSFLCYFLDLPATFNQHLSTTSSPSIYRLLFIKLIPSPNFLAFPFLPKPARQESDSPASSAA